MAIQFPATRKVVADRAKTDVQAQLPTSNPFLKNSFLGALITGFAGRIFDFYLQLTNLMAQLFPDTASGSFLIRWGSYVGITPLAATPASGLVTFTGTSGTLIASGTAIVDSNGDQYTTQANINIGTTTIAITSLTRVGSVATALTGASHNLASGMPVIIAGASGAQYNGTSVITITGANSFTYNVTGTPTTPDVGSPTVTASIAPVVVKSTQTGSQYNQVSGSTLTLTTPLAGVNNSAIVQFSEISGGTDDENINPGGAFESRVIYRYANPIALFNDAAITNQAKTVPGVTRVFVQDCTPYVGAVTVYFMRDSDVSPIPSAQDVTNVLAALEQIAPANTQASDIKVTAPTAVTVNFTFTSVTPSTPGLQQAIKNNLATIFSQIPIVGQNLSHYAYEAAIWQSTDINTGAPLQSFVLSAPAGSITCTTGQIAVLGTVTFS